MASSSQRREHFSTFHGGSTTGGGMSRKSTRVLPSLTIRSSAEQEDSVNTMWSAYMKEAGEYDKIMTDAWREDAKGFLAFVSRCPLIQYVHSGDNVKKGQPFLLNRCRLPHRKL